MSRHLVRINAPKTWKIPKKRFTFITKPRGSHAAKMGLPLLVVLRDILRYVRNSREAKKLLNSEDILVDGNKTKDIKRGVGLFDILSIPRIKENYRIYTNKQGKIDLQRTPQAGIKPCKIIGKTLVNGKVQLNLYDGNNILADNSYKVGDTIVLEIPTKRIINHFKLEKDSVVYITGGKHLGYTGQVESVSGNKVICKSEDELLIIPKRYAFILGKNNSIINI